MKRQTLHLVLGMESHGKTHWDYFPFLTFQLWEKGSILRPGESRSLWKTTLLSLKNFLLISFRTKVEQSHQKSKRQLIEWKEVFEIHVSDRGLWYPESYVYVYVYQVYMYVGVYTHTHSYNSTIKEETQLKNVQRKKW